MTVGAVCPQCGTRYKVQPDWIGKSVRCRKCQEVFCAVELCEPTEGTVDSVCDKCGMVYRDVSPDWIGKLVRCRKCQQEFVVKLHSVDENDQPPSPEPAARPSAPEPVAEPPAPEPAVKQPSPEPAERVAATVEVESQHATPEPLPQAESPPESPPRDDSSSSITLVMTEPSVSPLPAAGSSAGSERPQYGSPGLATSVIRREEAEVPTDWKVGDVFLDRYEVTGFLGQGGFGIVYKVHHRGWNTDLAVKTPLAKMVALAGGVESFEHEAETWVNLGLHPNAVSCYYVRRLGGIPRVFAEFVSGGSLTEWIRDHTLYDKGVERAVELILDIAIQFAWGLDYAHEQGLIHRDVKPANVMMTPDGVAKVTDFGLAKGKVVTTAMITGSEGETVMFKGGVAGTPQYFSPEQAKAKTLTRRTDIWSWGLCVLEMFCGGRTWAVGQIAGEVLESYLEKGPVHNWLPKMPSALADLLARCFQMDPSKRPHNMLEVAEALKEIYSTAANKLYQRPEPRAGRATAYSLNNRAVSLLDLGRLEEGEKLWEGALQAQPHHPESTYNRGVILWRSGRLGDDSLVQQMEEVQRSHPGHWLASYLLGLVNVERGDGEASLKSVADVRGRDAERAEIRSLIPEAKERLRSIQPLGSHDKEVTSICFAPGGRYALSGSDDHTLKLWEIENGRCVWTFKGHTARVSSVYLSEDGRTAVSGSYDGTMKLWKIASGECMQTLKGHGQSVTSVCLSRDGMHALSGSEDQTLRLWRVDTGQSVSIMRGHKHFVSAVGFSPDASHAVSGSADNTIRLWEAKTGRCLTTLTGHQDYVTAVHMDPRMRHVISGSDDQTVRLWDLQTGQLLRTFEGHTASVTSVSVSSDWQYAVSGSTDRTIILWRLSSGRRLCTFKGHDDGVLAVALSPNCTCVVSGSADNTIKLWWLHCISKPFVAPMMLCRVVGSEEAFSAQNIYQEELDAAHQALTEGNPAKAARHVRSARMQSGYSRGTEALNVWFDLYTRLPHKEFSGGWEGVTFRGHEAEVTAVTLSPNGRYAITGSADRSVCVWDTTTGRCVRTFSGHRAALRRIFLSADGRQLFTVTSEARAETATVNVWEVTDGRCTRTFTLEGHMEGIRQGVPTHDWRYFISGGVHDQFAPGRGEFTLKIWEMATARSISSLEGHNHSILSVAITADGQYALSGSADNTLKLWEIATGRCLQTYVGHEGKVNSVALSADGQYALSGGADRMLKLWSLAAGRSRLALWGHEGEVLSVCVSYDGRYALSGSTDKTLKLWDLRVGRFLRTFEGHTGDVLDVCISQDGRYALSGSADKTAKLWILDWELEERNSAPWDKGAKPYLVNFLTSRTPYAGEVPRLSHPSPEHVVKALSRRGDPDWLESDFKRLLYDLGCAGYGWLDPDGVRNKLELLAANWKRPPAFKGSASSIVGSLVKGEWMSKLLKKD